MLLVPELGVFVDEAHRLPERFGLRVDGGEDLRVGDHAAVTSRSVRSTSTRTSCAL